MYATVGGPHESEGNVKNSHYEWHVRSYEQVDGGDEGQGEEAVAKKTNTLEEADGPAEQLSVQRDHGTSQPNDNEDNLEQECLVIGLRAGREHHRKNKCEDERAPQVPVANFLPLLLDIVRLVSDAQLQRIDDYLELTVDSQQVTFL